MRRILPAGLAIMAAVLLSGCTIVLPGASAGTSADELPDRADEAAELEAIAACDEVYDLLYKEGARESFTDFSDFASANAEAARLVSQTALLSEYGPIYQSQSDSWSVLAGGDAAGADPDQQMQVVEEVMDWDYKVGERFLSLCSSLTE